MKTIYPHSAEVTDCVTLQIKNSVQIISHGQTDSNRQVVFCTQLLGASLNLHLSTGLISGPGTQLKSAFLCIKLNPHAHIYILDQNKLGGRGFISSSARAWGGGLYMGLVERERNTERAGHTGTKEATVRASSSGALTWRGRGLSSSLWTGVNWKFPKSWREGSRALGIGCACESTKKALCFLSIKRLQICL